MWEILLLYDKSSNMLFSFMKDTRFKDIRKVKRGRKPQYIRALLLHNQSLQAEIKQQKLFGSSETECENEQLKTMLDSLCANFIEPVVDKVKHHALIVFSSDYGQLTSLKAYMLDSDLDVVFEKNLLDIAKPIMSNEVDKVSKDDSNYKKPKITEKANRRLSQKGLVALKSLEQTENKQR